MTTKKNLLWGDSTPLHDSGWVGYDDWDFSSDGKRKTYLQPSKGITGFVSPAGFESPGLRLKDDPGLREEALTILRS